MSEYISREETLKRLCEDVCNVSDCQCDEARCEEWFVIHGVPAADVVEVVRCKDCKYSEHWYRDKRLCRLWYGEEKPSAPIDVFDDGFCNYGERREDDG